MRRILLSLLLALPLFGELPPGTSRIPFRDDITDASYLAATGDVLWVGSLLDDTIDRVDLNGERTMLAIPPIWSLTVSFGSGPDGALWLGSSGWIARLDPVTNQLERWPLGPGGAQSILSGPDGNLWFLFGRSVVRMRPDGVFLSTYDVGGTPTTSAFGSDGALYMTLPGKLVRITAEGERTEFPASPRGELLAGVDTLWSVGIRAAFVEAPEPSVNEIVKMSYRGETLATYRIDMVPIAADPSGNLWLRAKTAEGDVVGRLSASGVLTRFGPLPSPMSTECHPRSFGGLAFLTDGRVAMTDYYMIFPRTMLSPCVGVSRSQGVENAIVLLDPLLAPVLSIETLDKTNRRRSARH